MSGGWLDINGPSGTRREALLEGLTRIGESGADIILPGAGEDQLHLWNRPPRLQFLGSRQRPTCSGQPFDEHELRPGDRILWAGHELVYGGEAAEQHQAELEELPAASAQGAGVGTVAPEVLRCAARVRAGLACELGLADPKAAKRWRDAVLASRFDADECAREILPTPPGVEGEQRLLERSGSLLRDFLMAATLSGAAGVRRKAREKGRGFVAFVVTQGLALLIFVALIAAALFLLRFQGTSIDAAIDRWLPG